MPSIYEQTVDKDAPNNSHAFLVNMVGGGKRVLELGAATGHVTRALVEEGCTVTAVEYDPGAAADLEDVAQTTIVGDLNDPTWADTLPSHFDVVTAGDVLEHLLDPVGVLRRMSTLLKDDGYVVISLPHIAHADVRMSLLQGSFRYTPWGLLDQTHIRFFTIDNVKKMVSEAGLVITEMRRVRVPAFESEQAVPRGSVNSVIVDAIMADPEAETYQFVFTAVREGSDHKVRKLSESHLAMTAEMERLRREVDLVRARLTASRRKLRAERRASALLRSSRTFRYSAKPREVYRRLRQTR